MRQLLAALRSAGSMFSRSRGPGLVRIAPAGAAKGCVAISYIGWPFREGWQSPKARGHTNAFEVVAMAEAFRSHGLRVEVVDYNDRTYRPPGDCLVAIDIHSNLELWNEFLNADCQRILHATGSHWLLWNRSEMSRLESVRDRKGLALQPRRQVEPSRSVEVASSVTVLGNEYTMGSFAFSGKPVRRIPISSAYEFDWPVGRDFERARRKFLWVGSYGMVHKGLDLVLDAFSGLPDLQLTVCGRPEKEHDFFRVYEREFTKYPNIHLHGWIDMASDEFRVISQTHAAVIYPSCAEGGAGSVIHCMHAGMLPVCTPEASVDMEDFGVPIASGSVEDVRNAANVVASLAPGEVERRARAAWEHVRRVHTRNAFVRNYDAFANDVLTAIS
jgi:hypothetical protein